MGIVLALIGIVVALFCVAYLFSTDDKKKWEKNTEGLKKTMNNINFNPDNFDETYNKRMAIGISELREELIIFHRKDIKDEYSYRLIPFSSVVDGKIKVNNDTVTQVSKLPAVAGLALGGVGGGVLGGVLANRNSQSAIREASVDLILDDLKNPMISIPFLRDIGTAYDTNANSTKEQIENAEKWFHIISIVAKRNMKNI